MNWGSRSRTSQNFHPVLPREKLSWEKLLFLEVLGVLQHEIGQVNNKCVYCTVESTEAYTVVSSRRSVGNAVKEINVHIVHAQRNAMQMQMRTSISHPLLYEGTSAALLNMQCDISTIHSLKSTVNAPCTFDFKNAIDQQSTASIPKEIYRE